MQYWLVKSEPSTYSWEKFIHEGGTCWDGVRNFQARNNLHAMKVRDFVLFYHSNEERAVVGLAEVSKEAYQDPSTIDARWVAVDLVPKFTIPKPVALRLIKADARLKEIGLVKQGRLSVIPLKAEEFDRILELGS